MRGPHPQSRVTLLYRGHVTNKKRYNSFFTKPMVPNFAVQGLRMKKLHPQSHVTHRPSSHITNQRRYISTVTRPMDPKLSRVVAQDEGTPPTKLCDTSTTWWCDKSKLLYLHFLKACGSETQEDTGYSVIVTIEVCPEGYWIIQVSAYFHPSLSKKYIMSNVKEAAEIKS